MTKLDYTMGHLLLTSMLLALHSTLAHVTTSGGDRVHMGTVWWEQTFAWNQSAHLQVQWILEPFAPNYSLPADIDVVAVGNPSRAIMQAVERALQQHGRTWRAVLMTRDPRDSIVSGLHYHKWSYESWLQRPSPLWARWAGLPAGSTLTLQECVQRVNTSVGLLVEMDLFTATFERMCSLIAWQHPHVLVVRYEDLWENPALHFRNAMDFLYDTLPTGMTIPTTPSPYQARADALYNDAMAYTNHQRATRAAAASTSTSNNDAGPKNSPSPRPLEFHADGRVKADVARHNRRGSPGEWRSVFEEVHKKEFTKRFGGLVTGLLYEVEGGEYT